MDHRRAQPQRARHRVVLVRSGNGGAIESWGSVIGHPTVAFDHAKGRRRGRFHDIDQRRRERGDAYQPAAFPVGRMRSFSGDRLCVQRHRRQAMVAVGAHMRMPARVVVHMAILVDMLRRHFIMHVNHARHMILVGQTRSDGMFSGQSIRDRRCQHAKQIGQGDDPPGSHRFNLVRFVSIRRQISYFLCQRFRAYLRTSMSPRWNSKARTASRSS
jgi:hypothetical protein